MSRIKINQLLPTAHVDPLRFSNLNTDQPIEYIADPNTGELYIADGNHRYFKALLDGEDEIPACPSTLPLEIQTKWLNQIKNS